MKHVSLLLIPALLCISQITHSQLSGWTYRMPISVTENSDTTISNYQLKLTYNTQMAVALGIIQPDGRDIRFASDCGPTPTLYNYWIEGGIGTSVTVIWVKIDTLHANETKNIYLYAQNPNATAVSSLPSVFVGPNSSTDSTANTSLSSAGACQRGYRFAPTEDVLVTNFGRFEPNGTTRYLTLFDFNTQAILSQIQVGGAANMFSYGNLPSPIWLTQDTQYLMEMFTENGENYYFGAAPAMGQHMVYFDMRYCNGCTQNTFPTNTLQGMHYGYPDFWYYTKTNVSPAPTYTFGEPGTPGQADLAISGNTGVCVGNNVQLTSNATGHIGWSTGSAADTISVTPTFGTNTYSLSAYASNGCLDTAFFEITGYDYPNVDAQVSDDNICAGTAITLNSVSIVDASVSWDNGGSEGGSVSPTSTTTYHVTATSTQGSCVDQDSVTVTVNQLPTVTANATATSICVGDEVTLNGGGADTYIWNSVVNNVPFAPANTATYTVTGTDANGCASTASVTVTVGCFGISENLNAGIRIYPNPATEVIMFGGLDYTIDITVVDMAGRKIKSVNNISNSLEIADLGKGAYSLLIYRSSTNELIQKTNLIKK